MLEHCVKVETETPQEKIEEVEQQNHTDVPIPKIENTDQEGNQVLNI